MEPKGCGIIPPLVDCEGICISSMVITLVALEMRCLHMLALDVSPQDLGGTECFFTNGADLVPLPYPC